MDDHESAGAEETKRKFREALEAKKQKNSHGIGGGSGGDGSAVHGAHAKAGSKREFRRKSG